MNEKSESPSTDTYKKTKIANEPFRDTNDWITGLPTEVWLQILGYVHHQHNLNYHQFFKPTYARVSKLFNACANTLSKLPSEKSYQLMAYCLIGKVMVQKLIEDFKFPRENQYQLLFNHICVEVAKISRHHSFNDLEKFTNNIINYCKETDLFVFKKPTFSGYQRKDFLSLFFNLTKEKYQLLTALTPNEDCYFALMALAYIQKNKSLEAIEQLACFFAETGFLKGTLFILEFCQGFNVWCTPNPQCSLQSNKNDFLLNVLKYSLKWPDVGTSIGYYIMEHYHFYYDANFILSSIYQCKVFTPAIKLLLNDVRHYQSSTEMLKIIALIAPALASHYSLHSFHGQLSAEIIEKLQIMNKFVKLFASNFHFDEGELNFYTLPDRLDRFEEDMLTIVYSAVRIITSYIEHESSQTMSHTLPALLSNRITQIELVGDLAEFFNAPSQISDNQTLFYQEVADLCQQIPLHKSLQ
ncbi:hypothetical protein [Legionella cardiaca]|uniref:F-box domain-containing protein n=1 Tax=Legionella cardiaca TaxID=1071983 RepID=A0ABY8AXV7_9GAMM|nr:hypothetical protein [Legionella cardiaca]WED43942.1 hypothetical protein PXX05_03930 [Legionella cardiaca]